MLLRPGHRKPTSRRSPAPPTPPAPTSCRSTSRARTATLPDLPVTVTAQATVTDVNRQAWSSTTDLLVHPAELLRRAAQRPHVRAPGRPARHRGDRHRHRRQGRRRPGGDGHREPHRSGSFENGEWTEAPVDTQTCDVTSAAEAVTCTLRDRRRRAATRSRSTVADDTGGQQPQRADPLGQRRRRQAELATSSSRRSRIVPDKADVRAGRHRRAAGAGPVQPGRGPGHDHPQRHRVDTIRFEVVDGSAVVRRADRRDATSPNLDVVDRGGRAPPATGRRRHAACPTRRHARRSPTGTHHAADARRASRTLHRDRRPRDDASSPGQPRRSTST